MNSTTKSVLVLIVTLGIGVAIGAMLWAAVHNMQMERTRSLRDRDELSRRIENAIVPQDETQREQVHAIVETYHSRLSHIYRQSSRSVRNAVDSLRVQLGDVLDETQLERLDDWLRANRRSGSRNTSRDSSQSNSDRSGSQ